MKHIIGARRGSHPDVHAPHARVEIVLRSYLENASAPPRYRHRGLDAVHDDAGGIRDTELDGIAHSFSRLWRRIRSRQYGEVRRRGGRYAIPIRNARLNSRNGPLYSDEAFIRTGRQSRSSESQRDIEIRVRQQTYILLRSTGLSYTEIAQATGVATASVGALLARAEREFRRRYHERVSASRA